MLLWVVIFLTRENDFLLPGTFALNRGEIK